MARLKRFIKAVVSGLLYYSGALHILKRILLKDRAVVLMYHRVLTEEELGRSSSHKGIIVGDGVFEKQIRFLSRTFEVMRPEDFNRHLEKGVPFKSGSCLLTFDDGWEDNYTNALPVLERFRIPALVFLTEGFIGSDRVFWQERMTASLMALCRERTPKGMELLRRYGLLSGAGECGGPEDICRFVSSRKSRTPAENGKVLEEIASCLGATPQMRQESFIGWDQAKEMQRRGISFGSHGVNHSILTAVGEGAADSEIRESRTRLQGRLGRTVESFSYPNGDLDEAVAGLVKRHGYKVAFTTRPGFVSHTDDPFRLNRINIHHDAACSTPLFFCRILGIF